MNDWKTLKLGEVAELRKEQVASNGVEQPYIGLEHIEQQSLRLNGIGRSDSVVSNKFKFYSGDILYGRLRPYFRKVYNPKFEGVCSTEIFVIKNKKNVDKDYLFYLVATEEFTNISNSGSSGTHMPRADWRQLVKSEWKIPDLPTQKEIAQILTTIDDKIELNLSMNQTLEAMAQAIFKEWFVDFNFPGFDGELVDGLPKGWRKGNVSEIMYVQNGYAFKSDDFFPEGKNGVIKIKNISNNVVDIVNMQFIPDEVAKYIDQKFKVESGDLLIAMTGAEVGKVGIVPNTENELWLNQRVGSFKEKIKYSKWYCYLILSTKEYQNILSSSASGSAQPNISGSQIERTEIILPTTKIIEEFGSIVNSFFGKILENYANNQSLTQTRDSLLPKLMSGQLEVV